MKKNEIIKLIKLWKKNKCQIAFYKLFIENNSYIYDIINLTTKDENNIEDLFNEATIGFIEALNDFDINSNEDFFLFCRRNIKKSILKSSNKDNFNITYISLDDEEQSIDEKFIINYSLFNKKNIPLEILDDLEKNIILNKYINNNMYNKELCIKFNLDNIDINKIEKRAFQKIKKALL